LTWEYTIVSLHYVNINFHILYIIPIISCQGDYNIPCSKGGQI